MKLATLLLAALLVTPSFGKGSRSGHHSTAKCASCARDSRGKIQRSAAARREFRRANPCPATNRTSGACPGYVIDHKQALKHGGTDSPGNMQWQTREEAREKDRRE